MPRRLKQADRTLWQLLGSTKVTWNTRDMRQKIASLNRITMTNEHLLIPAGDTMAAEEPCTHMGDSKQHEENHIQEEETPLKTIKCDSALFFQVR